ncbi:MspA family porin [Gordonia sputi]|uniref:MspA family porin n=1 Tax=Gordonia sputi TaxID=36823 RepID=UPI0036C2A1AC
MSKFSKLGRRGAAAVAVAAAAVIGATSMGAGHAEAQKLADGYKKVSGFNGEQVEIWRKGESGGPVGTVANNPLSRGVSLSGTYTAKGSSGVGGTLHLGYIIGCQVDISGISLSLGSAFDLTTAALSGSFSVSLPIKPGQVAFVSDVYDTDLSDKGVAALQVSNYQVELPHCGGYAAARSVVQVLAAKGYDAKDGTLNADGTVMQSTLYGQPFNVS